MSQENLPDDEVRLCPICRSSISVWATKCKHCGAEIGRPRVEETKLTLKDLGGEASNTYTVSGNVMDALESFRADELSAQEEEYRQQDAKKKSWFGKRKDKEGAGEVKGESEMLLPELDNYHKELAEGITETTTVQKREAARRAQAKPAITRTIFTVAAVAAGLVLLYLGGSFAVAGIKEYILARNTAPLPDCASKPNLALELLNRGEDSIVALEAARVAVDCYASEDNLAIAENVRGQFVREMNARLSSGRYDEREMRETSNWIDRANVDKDSSIRELQNRVLKDLADYSLMLSEVDFSNGRAMFIQKSGGEEELWVKKDELALDRFKVTRIRPDHVFLEDTLIGNRRLVSRINSKIAAE